MQQLMEETIAEAEQRIENNKNGVTGLATGLAGLDRLTSGWQACDLNIIAARPSVGKTAIALHLAKAAVSAGRHVVFYSIEMQGERLSVRRTGCNHGNRERLLRTQQEHNRHRRLCAANGVYAEALQVNSPSSPYPSKSFLSPCDKRKKRTSCKALFFHYKNH